MLRRELSRTPARELIPMHALIGPLDVRAGAPILAYLLVAPAIWFLFRKTWLELDLEANEARSQRAGRGAIDLHPPIIFITVALVLILQEYYGGRDFYTRAILPLLKRVEKDHLLAPGLARFIQVKKYDELYGYVWWSFTRFAGYVVVPFAVHKACFPRESLLDLGLRLRGLREHAWIYLVSLAVVLPATFLVSRSPEFRDYYPFYELTSRSWFDLIAWECLYFAQFLGLEIFFRGFMLSGLRRSLGSGAIFAMIVPYAMIHFHKPYLETCGAVIAGTFLGSLSMRTRSIYAGFFVHITVALMMDTLAILQKDGLPHQLWP